MTRTTRIALWVLLAALFILAGLIAVSTGALRLKEFTFGSIGQLLTTFWVLALFVERTIEVFITAWREPIRKELQVQSDAAAAALVAAPLNAAVIQHAAVASSALQAYKSETQGIALRASLALGCLISAVSVRALDVFVQLPPVALKEWAPLVRGITLNSVDVLIAGGLIGGGSEAIHKLMNVVTTYLDATTGRLKS